MRKIINYSLNSLIGFNRDYQKMENLWAENNGFSNVLDLALQAEPNRQSKTTLDACAASFY